MSPEPSTAGAPAAAAGCGIGCGIGAASPATTRHTSPRSAVRSAACPRRARPRRARDAHKQQGTERLHRPCRPTFGDGQQLPVLERADVGEVVQVACSHRGQGGSARAAARRGRAALPSAAGRPRSGEPGAGRATFADPADAQPVGRDVGERGHLDLEDLRACSPRCHRGDSCTRGAAQRSLRRRPPAGTRRAGGAGHPPSAGSTSRS